MIHSYGKDIPYRIELLSPNKQCALGDFSCGNEYLDKYLKVDSIKDENVVTYLFRKLQVQVGQLHGRN